MASSWGSLCGYNMTYAGRTSSCLGYRYRGFNSSCPRGAARQYKLSGAHRLSRRHFASPYLILIRQQRAYKSNALIEAGFVILLFFCQFCEKTLMSGIHWQLRRCAQHLALDTQRKIHCKGTCRVRYASSKVAGGVSAKHHPIAG